MVEVRAASARGKAAAAIALPIIRHLGGAGVR
jgi:hypothetical protein